MSTKTYAQFHLFKEIEELNVLMTISSIQCLLFIAIDLLITKQSVLRNKHKYTRDPEHITMKENSYTFFYHSLKKLLMSIGKKRNS